MPKKSRRPSEADLDARPSFARPPGAKVPRPSPSPPRKQRAREYSESSDEQDSFEELEQRRRGSPPKYVSRDKAKSSPATSPVKKHASAHVRDRERERRPERDRHKRKTSEPPITYDRSDRHRDRAKYSSGTSTNSASKLLSSNALSKLNQENDLAEFDAKRTARKKREKQYDELKATQDGQKKRRRKNRDVSGAIVEEGRSGERKRRKGGGDDGYGYYDSYDEKRELRQTRQPMSKKKKLWIIAAAAIILLILIVVIAVVASKKKSSNGSGGGMSTSTSNSTTPQNTCNADDTPASAKGTYLDVSTWLDTTDFNCTYTAETVGNLSVMGLYSDWDDSAAANGNTPPLNKAWQYGKMPFRGTNVGGWLNLEPFITPSMFNYAASDNVVDEWTLCQRLGSAAVHTMEQHYATFITKADFQAIKNAGLDHVRIPFGYWAVRTYDGDPFVESVSWRYLLRAIEWCREFGLRVNLDLHGVPGSQNGWAHSGHQGTINWLNGPNGDQNGQLSLDIHNQLSQFFAQPRYKNVVTFYGLVNEPKMIVMDDPQSVITWNEEAISLVRKNGITQQIVFSDGFLALTEWSDMMKGVDSKLMLDTHQYQIFNTGQLKLNHTDKINLACSGWTGIMTASNNPSTGWGPTMNGEFSQADTDCTPNLNNVGAGSRWAGNLDTNTGAGAVAVNTPSCATPPCDCAMANADPSTYTTSYKTFLKTYAEAQMHSFEQAQGWFYWTWKTESATQWSWKLGMEAGILPALAYQPDFDCSSAVPDFSDLPNSY